MHAQINRALFCYALSSIVWYCLIRKNTHAIVMLFPRAFFHSIESMWNVCVCVFMPFVQFILTVIPNHGNGKYTSHINIFLSLAPYPSNRCRAASGWIGLTDGPPVERHHMEPLFNCFSFRLQPHFICRMIKMWYLFFVGFVWWFITLWNGNFFTLHAHSYRCVCVCVCASINYSLYIHITEKSFWIHCTLSRLFNIWTIC